MISHHHHPLISRPKQSTKARKQFIFTKHGRMSEMWKTRKEDYRWRGGRGNNEKGKGFSIP
jgi:hypothetical protein